MGISESLLGKKNVDGNPYIEAIDPPASLPGGEVRILGRALKPPRLARPEILFSGMRGPIVVSSEDFVIARVPFGAQSGMVTVQNNGYVSNGASSRLPSPWRRACILSPIPPLIAKATFTSPILAGAARKCPSPFTRSTPITP